MKMDEVSYREFSSWGSVAIIATMLVYYINKLSQLDTSAMLNSATHNQLLFQVVVVTVITEILFQIIIAITKRIEAESKPDERDQFFMLKASQLSHGFISGFVAILILAVSQSDFLIEQLSFNLRGLAEQDVLLSVLVVGFAISQLIHHFALAVYYRKGS